MKTKKDTFFFLLILLAVFPLMTANSQAAARTIAPLVSTDWVASNLASESLVLLDVRAAEEYAAGHIQGSVNVPFTSWWVIRDDLLLELPEPQALFDLMSTAGIKADSRVVLIQKTDTDFARAEGSRVALTLIYGGIRNVAIMNGGINQWTAEGKELSTVAFVPPNCSYSGSIDDRFLVSKDTLMQKFWYTTVVDARIPEDYFGVAPLTFSTRPGHIPGAVCLPTPWIFTAAGLYKEAAVLSEMAASVVGKHKYKEIIVYCGVGGYAATWWYVLSEVLGYCNAKFYDGSIQEWTNDPDAPVKLYGWK